MCWEGVTQLVFPGNRFYRRDGSAAQVFVRDLGSKKTSRSLRPETRCRWSLGEHPVRGTTHAEARFPRTSRKLSAIRSRHSALLQKRHHRSWFRGHMTPEALHVSSLIRWPIPKNRAASPRVGRREKQTTEPCSGFWRQQGLHWDGAYERNKRAR